VDLDGSIGVEFSDTRGCDLVPGLANIRWGQKELSREIRNLDRSRVVDCQALDTSQRNILRNLYTETFQTDNEDVGGAHAAHGFVSQNIELSAVERLIDVCGSDDGLVDLHSGRKIDLGKLGGLGKRVLVSLHSCHITSCYVTSHSGQRGMQRDVEESKGADTHSHGPLVILSRLPFGESSLRQRSGAGL
jgi:hypothetical protein